MAFKTLPPAPAPSIPELLAQLPQDALTAVDIACLQALKTCIHALRVDDASTGAYLFTQDVRLYFAIEMNNALASVIKTRLPRASPRSAGRPPMAADKKALILASNTFKVRIVNLVDALNAFLRRAAGLWNEVPAKYIVDPKKLAPAIERVRSAFAALEADMPDDEELTAIVNSMAENVAKFERMLAYWVTIDRVDGHADKNTGMHSFPLIPEWIDACRVLARANALYLQRVK